MNGNAPSSEINIFDLQNSSTNYIDYLIEKGVKEYSLSEYYIQVGKPDSQQGWIIYISIWVSDFPKIINQLISYLLKQMLPFKIPRNNNIHFMINRSDLGYSNQGKIIIITPNSNTNLSTLLSDLTNFTMEMRGTNVPTAINIGPLIFTKYGSYEDTDNKTIVDHMGNRILDLDLVPPTLFNWLDWPFMQVEKPKISTNQKIIHGKYLLKNIIKPDAKGFVIKALYQKNIFSYKLCILKEGKVGMLEDNFGRDIEDRLKWQFELHKKLSEYIPIPKALDLFKENSDSFLSLEFIKGSSFGNFLAEKFNGNKWSDIKTSDKILIVDTLIKITNIINSLHEKNYVHRDINPENFIITKKNEIYLIDLELTYDLNNKMPNPPFERGTEGYMSPEQSLKQEPNIAQDYYAIGSLILMSMTQLNPYRLNRDNKILFKNNLKYFLEDREIIDLILLCYNENPNLRPSLKKISSTLSDYKSKISKNPIVYPLPITKLNKNDLKQCIANALDTLCTDVMLNDEKIWISPVSPRESTIGNIRIDHAAFPGFRKGISGILTFFSESKLEGFDIKKSEEILAINYEYLKNSISQTNNNLSSGLHTGLAGVAFAICSMIKSTLIPNNEENLKIIINCLSRQPSSLDISSGVAGFGLTLMKCSSLLPKKFFDEKIKNCIELILENQLSNGAWAFNTTKKKPLIITGFDHGIAGIINFLLTYTELFDDINIKTKAIVALNYLKSAAIRNKKSFVWPIAIGRKELYNFSNGDYLILRPFIKAYKMSNDIAYRTFTEKVLTAYPEHITTDWLSQEGGLSGLGEVYLDAWLVFENEEWLKRAEWIANVLIHNIYGTENKTYWIQDIPNYPSADLLTGNSGIIRFLLRFFSSKNLPYILDL